MTTPEPDLRAVVQQGRHWWYRAQDGLWRGCCDCDPGTADDTKWDWQDILDDIGTEPYEVSYP